MAKLVREYINESIQREEKSPNDVYDLRNTIKNILKNEYSVSPSELNSKINFIIHTIDRHYESEPSKEQLRIEIERAIK